VLYVLCLFRKGSSTTPLVVHRRALLRASAYLVSFLCCFLPKAAQDMVDPGYTKTSEVTWCLLCLSGAMTVATYALQIGGVPPQLWRGRSGSSSNLAFEVSFSEEVPIINIASVTYFDVDDVNGDILDDGGSDLIL